MRPTPASAPITRRDFLATTGAAALLAAALPSQGHALRSNALDSAQSALPARLATPPIGIELYALRTELARDLPATLRATRAMGYEAVEFYAPYMNWSLPYAKDVRMMLDDLGLKCPSTHNALSSFVPSDAMTKAIELNQILGARYVVLASPPWSRGTMEQYKLLTEQLAGAVAVLAPHGLKAGYHNHEEEWLPLANGTRPMEYIADNTPQEFMLQLDVGTCVKAGADPVEWTNRRKGRIRSVHLKDWGPGTAADEKQFRVLFGEGAVKWEPLIAALESAGGVECYLMEQEGSRYSELETAKRCLETWKKLRG